MRLKRLFIWYGLIFCLAMIISAVESLKSQATPAETARGKPFACHGSEKMIYDLRMGPQALWHENKIYIVYQADSLKNVGSPFIVSYDTQAGRWSEPLQLGEVTGYDHHFAPVLWLDREGFFHVLYHCHGGSGKHLVSKEKNSITSWKVAGMISKSISYPKILTVQKGKRLLYHRVFGHMGYWTYLLSGDGSSSWRFQTEPVTDFDQKPESNFDPWAGSYHSAIIDSSGENLHIAFVYKDDSDRPNPRYNSHLGKDKRYNLYYLKLALNTGEVFSVKGKKLERPVTRAAACQCIVLDSEYRITNMPSLALDERGNPAFILPMSDSSPEDCLFHFIKSDGISWKKIPITRTNSIWAGSYLINRGSGRWIAFLTIGKVDGEVPLYGGGELQRWESENGGLSWFLEAKLDPEPGLLYNNPTPVVTAEGKTMEGWLLFYGWEGPRGIQEQIRDKVPGLINSGKAFLWQDGEYK